MNVDLVARLGGAPAVRAAVDELYERLLVDDVVAPYFDGVDVVGLIGHVTDVLVLVLGPDAQGHLSRDRLRDAHRDLDVTDEAFDRLAGHLLDTLQHLGVADDVVDDAVERVAGLRPLVV